jgi:hypothetical protein
MKTFVRGISLSNPQSKLQKQEISTKCRFVRIAVTLDELWVCDSVLNAAV